ncbi:arylsulfatase [Candidatus Magnetomorum sp. HK-1]|nr:arylsulfatase [Candidatus Magnetomorum sp. HK-1]
MNRYTTFFNESQKDFKLIFFCASTMFIYRIVLMINFSNYFKEPLKTIDYLLACYVGLRFDIALGAYIALLPFLVTSFCLIYPSPRLSNLIRNSMLILFSVLNSIILLANYLFFIEYEDTFNQWIFGAFYDDLYAVLSTVWKSYPVLLISCTLLGAIILAIIIGRYFIYRPFYSFHFFDSTSIRQKLIKILIVIIIFFLFFLAVRGSIGPRPVQLKDAGITRDALLNKMIPNPYFSLRYAVKNFIQISKASGINAYVSDSDFQAVVTRYWGKSIPEKNLDIHMKKTAKGVCLKNNRHVFLIVMESFDAWPLLDAYQSFNITPNMRQLGKNGLLMTKFLSSGSGTMTSLTSIITGIQDVGVITNYQASSRKPFPTSLAPQFKRLGYQTNLYYGGYLSWQRIGDFCKDQGFDRVFGGGHMGKLPIKEWGVDDQAIFEFIEKKFDISTPSLNLILSTSNHPPYDLPVYKMGFPYHQIPQDLKDVYDETWPLKIFGHLWYSDKVLGEFIDRMSQKLPNALFVVTGDHWSRKFLNPRPDLYISSAVPLLLYTKQGLPYSINPEKLAGSHLNIAPTLIELCAHKGFTYYSMCKGIFDKDRIPIGIGRECLITPCNIWDIKGRYERISSCSKPFYTSEKSIRCIKDFYGIGWWRLMKGSLF